MIGSAVCWLQSILIQILWINPEDQCSSHSWFPKASLFPHCLTPKGRVRVTPTSVSSRDLRIREEQGQKYIVQWGSILQNITNKTSINKRNTDLSREVWSPSAAHASSIKFPRWRPLSETFDKTSIYQKIALANLQGVRCNTLQNIESQFPRG